MGRRQESRHRIPACGQPQRAHAGACGGTRRAEGRSDRDQRDARHACGEGRDLHHSHRVYVRRRSRGKRGGRESRPPRRQRDRDWEPRGRDRAQATRAAEGSPAETPARGVHARPVGPRTRNNDKGAAVRRRDRSRAGVFTDLQIEQEMDKMQGCRKPR